MRGQEALMSSARTGEAEQDQWRTPRWLFDKCEERFGVYRLDAAADKTNALCPSFFYADGRDGALAKEVHWSGKFWCNPPYSMLKEFADKAIEELQNENSVGGTFLIPARTDTKAFHKLVTGATDIIFLKGRVRFDDLDGKPAVAWNKKLQRWDPASAPFPSVIIHIGVRIFPVRVTFEDWRMGRV